MTQTLFFFALVSLFTVATPGPTVLLALSNGSRFGVRASLPGMAGAVVSDFVLITAVALGLGALLAASELAFSVVKWVGVAYLAYLGLRMLMSRGTLAVPGDEAAAQAPSARSIFMRSFLVAASNPKGYLMFTAFLPQFIVPTEPQFPQYATLAITFALIDFVVMLMYAMAGVQALRVLKARGVLWLDRFCGGVLLALAGSLALYRRNA